MSENVTELGWFVMKILADYRKRVKEIHHIDVKIVPLLVIAIKDRLDQLIVKLFEEIIFQFGRLLHMAREN